MFGLRAPELVIILVIAMLLFGPKKLPQLGAGLGKSIRDFKKAMAGEDEEKTPPAQTPTPPAPAQAPQEPPAA
jgi:sec-independent protein translocase protein TatA